MASESVGTAIIVIAGVILASMVSAALLSQISVVSSSMRIVVRNAQEKLQTEITIVFASINTTSLGKHFVIYVKNTGSRSIAVQELTKSDVYLVDDSKSMFLTYSSSEELGKWCFEETKPDGIWSIGETIIVRIFNATSLGIPTKIAFVLPNGVLTEYLFWG